MLYVGGWDAAEDISGLQAAGVSAQFLLDYEWIMGEECTTAHFVDWITENIK